MAGPPNAQLTTRRLLLRPIAPDDAQAIYTACQDPAIQRWTTVPSPYLLEHAEFFHTRDAASAVNAGNAGALPAGLTLNSSTGVISGTPTAGGTANFTIRATDTNGNFGPRAYALIIGTDSLTVNPSVLAPAINGRAWATTSSAPSAAISRRRTARP